MDDLVRTNPVVINDAVAEALDAIGDEPEYADARRELEEAARLLKTGTTAEIRDALERGLAAMDASCPI